MNLVGGPKVSFSGFDSPPRTSTVCFRRLADERFVRFMVSAANRMDPRIVQMFSAATPVATIA